MVWKAAVYKPGRITRNQSYQHHDLGLTLNKFWCLSHQIWGSFSTNTSSDELKMENLFSFHDVRKGEHLQIAVEQPHCIKTMQSQGKSCETSNGRKQRDAKYRMTETRFPWVGDVVLHLLATCLTASIKCPNNGNSMIALRQKDKWHIALEEGRPSWIF